MIEDNFILKVEDLRTFFNTEEGIIKAVDGVSFEIKRDSILGLVGETGCGKSVTALSIFKLIQHPGEIKSGKIIFEGRNLLEMSESEVQAYRGNQISMIFQDPFGSLNPVLKIGDQIAEVFMFHQKEYLKQTAEASLSRNDSKPLSMKEIANIESAKLLESIGIPDSKDILSQYPHELSGGMRQRVMIAISLACQPKLLICDEPTTALDATIEAQILELIKSEKVKRHNSILFITHNLGIVYELCDYVAVMNSGHIIEYGPVKDVLINPKHPYTQKLLHALPKIIPKDQIQKSSAREEKKPPASLLSVRNFSVTYPIIGGMMKRKMGEISAVNNVKFDLYEGETLGLVGESGCGKTSLGNGILGLIPKLSGQSSGEIIFEGNLLQSTYSKELRKKIQMVFQDPDASLNPRMKVVDIIGEPLRNLLNMRKRDQIRQRALELLEIVSMKKEHLDRYPHEFSGGEKQRIVIARALACNPKIIILDEPTSSLDVFVQAKILDLLKDLQKRFGLAYLFITHNLSVIHHIGHRVAVMYLGKFVEMGTVEDIFYHAKHPYTQALLSAHPSLNEKEKLNKIILNGEIASMAHPPSGCSFHSRCFNIEKGCAKNEPEGIDISETHKVWCVDYYPKIKSE
jgi:peptide/nickel transport system ATP-binding protein